MKVRFLKPFGDYGENEIADVGDDVANALIAGNLAEEFVEDVADENKDEDTSDEMEKAITNRIIGKVNTAVAKATEKALTKVSTSKFSIGTVAAEPVDHKHGYKSFSHFLRYNAFG